MTDLLTLLPTALVSLLWYLLKQKDEKQQAEINTLFSKHDADVIELQSLKLQIADDHYKKVELNYKFDRLETAFIEGFKSLVEKMDKIILNLYDKKDRQ
jgi:nitrogenase molybdenum-iron protein alpha/beta subunit